MSDCLMEDIREIDLIKFSSTTVEIVLNKVLLFQFYTGAAHVDVPCQYGRQNALSHVTSGTYRYLKYLSSIFYKNFNINLCQNLTTYIFTGTKDVI